MTAAFRAARRQTLALAVLTTVISVPAAAAVSGATTMSSRSTNRMSACSLEAPTGLGST